MNNDKKELLKQKLKSSGILKNKIKKESNKQFSLSEESIRFLKNNLFNQWMNRKDSSKFVIIDQTKIPTCSN